MILNFYAKKDHNMWEPRIYLKTCHEWSDNKREDAIFKNSLRFVFRVNIFRRALPLPPVAPGHAHCIGAFFQLAQKRRETGARIAGQKKCSTLQLHFGYNTERTSFPFVSWRAILLLQFHTDSFEPSGYLPNKTQWSRILTTKHCPTVSSEQHC